MRFINFVKPLLAVLPEIEAPKKRVDFAEKIVWTLITLVIFLALSQVPLFGIQTSDSPDPLSWLRVLTASNRETLMELGISPIVTSGMVLQLVAGSRLISFNRNSKEDRANLQSIQKLAALVITAGQAISYVSSGMYGDAKSLGAQNCVLIVLQFFATGVVVVLLDEMMQKGYGIGSGASLFIAANICEKIVWKSLSPVKVPTENGPRFEGALISFLHLLLFRPGKVAGISESFFREQLPNMTNFLSTALLFLVVIYFEGFRVELPIKHERVKTKESPYPIKLFYTSNIPIILQSALVSNLFFISKILYQSFPKNFFVRVLGVWEKSLKSNYSVPVGGLALYVSPPGSLNKIFSDPLHVLFYISFILGTSAVFSRNWIYVSGSSPRDVAKLLAKEGMTVKGYRGKNMERVLGRHIPIAATFGGLCIGALTIFADYLGVIGSGTGVLLVVTFIFEYFEVYVKESQKEGGIVSNLLKNAR